MLSLNPRFDLFHFEFPKDYFPEELMNKYNEFISSTPGVITNILDYVNESIQGVNFPAIGDLSIEQSQVSHNIINSQNKTNIEPSHNNAYLSPDNILTKIDNKFAVTLRQNQGLMNYFFLYETCFYRYCKPYEFNNGNDVFNIDIMNESGSIITTISLFQPIVNNISGLEFSYNKQERQVETFTIEFTFNNIDIDFKCI